jgi:hypothetical protein
MNLLPCRPATPGTTTDSEAHEFDAFPPQTMVTARASTPAALTTPFEMYYGVKPDYCTLFQWGCLGYYRRLRDSSGKRGQFDMHSSVGIALGRSNHTSGMIFWDPVTQRMNVSADYKLDPDAAIGTHFPSVTYDSQISPLILRGGRNSTKEPFPPGSDVQVEIDGEYYHGIVQSVPVEPRIPNYQITFSDSPDTLEVPPTQLTAPDQPVFPLVAADSDSSTNDTVPSLPEWIQDDSKVTLLLDGSRRRGALVSTDSGWTFQQRTASGQITFELNLADLPVTWKDRLAEGTFELGWQQTERAYHVPAKGLTQGTPASFQRSMRPDNPNCKVWIDSYLEEAEGLKEQNTYYTISAKEYREKHQHIQVIPSMAVQTVKKDENGALDRAKSRIVALGNFEVRVWEKSEKFAPVLPDESSRVMTSMAVQSGRREKQGDCKNAFCQSYLPKDETIIIRPPKGCPLSKPGELWVLLKTLYGLCRSPYHWYQAIKKIFLTKGLTMSPHNPCVFYGSLKEGLPPIYIGIYVDDFKYFSLSDEVEELFESRLGSKCRVDFMGEVSWFLGCKYKWETLPVGRLTVSITQTAKAEDLIETHGMQDCNPVSSPYKSGYVIDRIPDDGIPVEDKMVLVKKYQGLVGGLLWLQRHTRPDISTSVSLLSSYSHNPSHSHYETEAYGSRKGGHYYRLTPLSQPKNPPFRPKMEPTLMPTGVRKTQAIQPTTQTPSLSKKSNRYWATSSSEWGVPYVGAAPMKKGPSAEVLVNPRSTPRTKAPSQHSPSATF